MKELYKDKGALLENRKKGLQSSMVQIAFNLFNRKGFNFC